MRRRGKHIGIKYALLRALVLVFALSCRSHSAEPEKTTTRLNLLGTSPAAVAMPLVDFPVPSQLLDMDEKGESKTDPSKYKRAWYHNIYPDIDLVCYGNDYQVEYIFVVSSGADPSLVRMMNGEAVKSGIDELGNINIELPRCRIIESKPVVFLQAAKSKRRVEGFYSLDADNIIDIIPGSTFTNQVTNEEFLNFLNEAQASSANLLGANISFDKFPNETRVNPANLLGANMHFDKDGNVWINPSMPADGKMFDIMSSRLTYNSAELPGSRYFHQKAENGKTPFVRKPVAGVSWLGAMKYCNWLTIKKGRGAGNRCYREGANRADWTQAQGTNWAKGFFQAFSIDELKGYQLATPYSPDEGFVMHILLSFYMESSPAAIEQVEETERAKEKATAAEGPLVSPEDVNIKIDAFIPSRTSGQVSPNGIIYKEPPATTEETVPGQPPTTGGGGGEEPVIIPPSRPPPEVPPGGLANGTLIVYSSNPDSGVLIDVSPDKNSDVGANTPFTRYYFPGTNVTVTAPRVSPINTVFQEWLSTDSALNNNTNLSLTFVINAGITLTAVYYTPVRLTVTSFSPWSGVDVQVSEPDVITGLFDGVTTFTRDYEVGTTVTLTAPVNAGLNVFNRWMKDGVNYTFSPTTTVVMAANTTMTVVYTPHTLYVRSSAPNSGVVITSDPDIYGSTSGTTPFELYYDDGHIATLTASTNAPNGYVFREWQLDGADYSTNRIASLLMDVDHIMLAIYMYVPGPVPNPPVSPSEP